ncbi:hypothetical protein [Edwardsiella tarda]|uniref:hypothetical protein n=1 Tax=Edwardsiella tarda TaxID=636 RepID=UPI0011874B8E|nr:hypothetical protein [Edwardsiella tarda]AKH87701.2 hypothetical protein AAW15_00350 [Edwardsiella tarda]
MLNLRGVNNRHEPDLRAMVGFAMFNISFTLMLFPQYISDAYLYGYEVMGGMMACWGAGAFIGLWLFRSLRGMRSLSCWGGSLLLLYAILMLLVPAYVSVVLLACTLFLLGIIHSCLCLLLSLGAFPHQVSFSRCWQPDRWPLSLIIGEVSGISLAALMPDPVRGISLGGLGGLAAAIFYGYLVPGARVVSDVPIARHWSVMELMVTRRLFMVIGWGSICLASHMLFMSFPTLMKTLFDFSTWQSGMVIAVSDLIVLGFYPGMRVLGPRWGAGWACLGVSIISLLIFLLFSFCAVSLISSIMVMLSVHCCWLVFVISSVQQGSAAFCGASGGVSVPYSVIFFSCIAYLPAGLLNSYLTITLGMAYLPLFAVGICLVGIVCVLGGQVLSAMTPGR